MDREQSRIHHQNSNSSHKKSARSKDCSTQSTLLWFEIKTQADVKKHEETLGAKAEKLETQLTQSNEWARNYIDYQRNLIQTLKIEIEKRNIHEHDLKQKILWRDHKLFLAAKHGNRLRYELVDLDWLCQQQHHELCELHHAKVCLSKTVQKLKWKIRQQQQSIIPETKDQVNFSSAPHQTHLVTNTAISNNLTQPSTTHFTTNKKAKNTNSMTSFSLFYKEQPEFIQQNPTTNEETPISSYAFKQQPTVPNSTQTHSLTTPASNFQSPVLYSLSISKPDKQTPVTNPTEQGLVFDTPNTQKNSYSEKQLSTPNFIPNNNTQTTPNVLINETKTSRSNITPNAPPTNLRQTFNTATALDIHYYQTATSTPNITFDVPPINEHTNIEPPSAEGLFINEPQDTLDFFSKTDFSNYEEPPSNHYNPNHEMCTPDFNSNTPPTNNYPNDETTPLTASLSPNDTQQTYNTTPILDDQNYDTEPSHTNVTHNATPTNEHTNIEPPSAACLFIKEPQDTLDFFSKTDFSINEEPPSNHYNPNHEMCTPDFNSNTPPTNNYPNVETTPSTASLSPNNTQQTYNTTPILDDQKYDTEPSHTNVTHNATPTNEHTNIEPPSAACLFINEPQGTLDFFSKTDFSINEEPPSNHYNPNHEVCTPDFNSNTPPTNNHPNDERTPSTASLSPNDTQQTYNTTPILDDQNYDTEPSHINVTPNAPPTNLQQTFNTATALDIHYYQTATSTPNITFDVPPINEHTNIEPPSAAGLFINEPQDTLDFFSKTDFSNYEEPPSNHYNPNHEMCTPDFNSNTPPTNNYPNDETTPSTASLSPNDTQQTFNTTPILDDQNYDTEPSHTNVTHNATPTNEHTNIEPPSAACLFINEPQDTLDFFSKTDFSINEEPPSNHYNPNHEMCTPDFNSNTPPTNNYPNVETTPLTASLSPNNTQQTYNTTPILDDQKYDTEPSHTNVTHNATPTNEHTNIEPPSAACLFINEPQDTLDFFSKTDFSNYEEPPSNHYNPNHEMCTPDFNSNTPPTNNHPNVETTPSTASLSPNNTQQTYNTTPILDDQNYDTEPSHTNVTHNATPTNEHTNIEPPSAACLFINEPQDTLDFFSKTDFSNYEEPPSNHYNPNHEMCTSDLNSNTPPTNNHPNDERTPSTASLSPNNTQQTYNTTPILDDQKYDTEPSHTNVTHNAPSPYKYPNIEPSSAASLFINEPQGTLDFFSKTDFSNYEEPPSNHYNPNQEMFTPNFNVNTPPIDKQTTIKPPSTASLFINEPQDGLDFFSVRTISRNEKQPPNRDNPNQKIFLLNLNNNFSPSEKISHCDETSSMISKEQQQIFDLFSTSSTPKDEGQAFAPNSNINKQTTQTLHSPSVHNSLNVEIETPPGNFRTRKPRHTFRTPSTSNKK